MIKTNFIEKRVNILQFFYKLIISFFLLFFFSNNAFATVKERHEYEKTGDVIWEVKTTEKIVSLTFDDGPHLINTPLLLDVLKDHEVKASFFVAGENVEMYPEITNRIIKEGHEIGNHTYTHIYNIHMTKEKMLEEIKKTNDILLRTINQKPTFFRPVGGYHNDVIISSATEQHHKVILWSWHQDPKDWTNRGSYEIANHVIKNIHPGDVILLHDGGGNRLQTIEAVKEIIPILKQQGYSFLTLSELTSQFAY